MRKECLAPSTVNGGSVLLTRLISDYSFCLFVVILHPNSAHSPDFVGIICRLLVACLTNKRAPEMQSHLCKLFVALIIIFLLSHLGLGRSTALSAALFLFNDWYSSGDEFNTSVAAIGASVQLAVVVEVILAVKLVLSAELAREAVGAFTVVAVEGVSWCYPSHAMRQ